MTWIQTYTGKRFDLLNPRAEDVDIRDIAHHLSMQCRFTGAAAWPYSVAQHSYLAWALAPEPLRLQALMHDAAEAYCGDVSSPLKAAMRVLPASVSDYDVVYNRVAAAIGARYGVDLLNLDPVVKEIDARLLATEAAALLPGGPREDWEARAKSYTFYVHGAGYHHDEGAYGTRANPEIVFLRDRPRGKVVSVFLQALARSV